MPQNTAPIFTLNPTAGWAALLAANIAKDGTGTVSTILTANASNGAFLTKISFEPAGTNVATIARIFLNNGLVNSTPANNTLIGQVELPATTLSESITTNLTAVQRAFNIAMPAGYKINVVLATAVAAGWHITAFGGDY